MAQLTCNALSIGYEGNMIAENLNFQVNQGDYLCILGQNGAGKSTLMKTILGLKAPLAGEIVLGDGLLRHEFSYLTQQSQIQKDFPASVWEIVLSGCQNRAGWRPFYNQEEKAYASGILAELGMTEFKKTCFRELSGGQQQRVLLARAFCATQKILFLDEPVSGLDQNISADFYTQIQKFNAEKNVTIIMISHDIQTALQYATHILHIGKNRFFGTKEAYLESEAYKWFQQAGGEES